MNVLRKTAWAGAIGLAGCMLILGQAPRRAKVAPKRAQLDAADKGEGFARVTLQPKPSGELQGRIALEPGQKADLNGATFTLLGIASADDTEPAIVAELATGRVGGNGTWSSGVAVRPKPGQQLIGCLEIRGVPEACSTPFRLGQTALIPKPGTQTRTKHDTAKAAINNVR